MSTPSSTNAVSPAGSSSPDLGDVSGASSVATIAVDDPTTDEAMHASTRSLAAAPYNSLYEDVPFTFLEIVDVLRNTPKKSAPGPDHISPAIMKALFRYHPRFFLMLFNAALALGYFPRCWRTAQRASSYRPICFSSVFGKTLERLLNGRLQYFLEKRGLVHPREYGFTRGRSPLLALHALKAHQYVTAVLVSLDFHGAFDSVWHPLVIPYFRERALPSGLYHLLCTFLADRSVFVRSNAGQVEANPTLGSPQGSPLSPLLSYTVIDSILSLRMPRGVIVQAYADDTIILVPVPSRDALDILASEVLRRVIEWSRAAKVSLNCDKSFCVLFSHGVGPHGARTSHLVFDRRLSFFHHADYLRQKVALLASRVATFFAMQRSCVSPAHSVNVPTGDPPGSLLRESGVVERRPPGRTLGVNARLPHGKHGSVAGLDACASNRPGANVSMPSSAFLLYAGILRSVPSDFGLLGWRMPMSTWRYTLRCLPRFLLCALQARGPVSLLALLPSTSTLMAPSQIPRLAQHVGRFRLTRTTSAYTTEVVAFHAALLHALTATYTLPLALYTDCLSLLQAFTSPCNAEQHVLTIRALLRRLSISVPGVGNDVADFLAQRAACVGLDRSLPLPFRAVRRQLRRELHVLWTARWRETNTLTELYLWIQDLGDIPWYFPPPPLLVTLVTWHGQIPHYFHRFNVMRQHRCPCGSYCLDMSHVLHACPLTAPHTARIEPQDAYRAASYGAILRCLRNRALLIGALRALNALPHVSRPLGLPTAHLYTEYVSESCEVGMARGPFRWGPRVLASLASQSSVCAIFCGQTGPADHLLPCPPWLLHIARMFPPTLLTARSGPAAYHVPRFYLLLCNKAREGQRSQEISGAVPIGGFYRSFCQDVRGFCC
ncbi:hypothetical protein HPB52_022446 [Rhipicephalus sanguineus]|uniref:Reverse transcriptase domain-containing protein n=1 Tax=Rhipicephalus sanguineus TaxID=34632 RepID=A0A9D4Q3G5_RHISA|nr:hypothetical protein HPB52_024298 [Rhipicephalus sanguineus]KAH7963708.1 hypothetical protein HPB52_022446 [Rhipicephalus sanguineus]